MKPRPCNVVGGGNGRSWHRPRATVPRAIPVFGVANSIPFNTVNFNYPFQMSTAFGLTHLIAVKNCCHTSRELMGISDSRCWWPRRQWCVLEKLARRPAFDACARVANPALAAAANLSLSIQKKKNTKHKTVRKKKAGKVLAQRGQGRKLPRDTKRSRPLTWNTDVLNQ